MKTPITAISSCFLGLLITAGAQEATPTARNGGAAQSTAPAVAAAEQSTGAIPNSATPQPAPTNKETELPLAPAEQAAPETHPSATANSNGTTKTYTGPKELRLNFRNAPLDSVLNYLSDAAGFIIVPKTGSELKGKVTMWSNQPVSKEEALDLLVSALDQNGYTAIVNGRTLNIYNKEDAKKQDIPVKSGNNPKDIPKNEQMVTQIIPVRFINAVQVSRDLQPLLPDKATMTANEGGNALIITDTQVNIRRMVEIIKALDTAIASVSSVRVFPLHFADAKALASVIKDLFAPQETAASAAQGGRGRFQNQFRAGGPGFGGRGGAASTDTSGGRAPSPRVVAVAEERSNSVVVSAPDDQMPVIEELIHQVDTNVEDITELRVFRLRFADAQETADLLTSLFSDTGTSSGTQGFRGPMIFGGRFGGAFNRGGNRNATTQESSRLQKQTHVVAVPDLRTGSVVVSAAHDLMTQIAEMIKELDSDPAKKQQVFVFDVQNTDPQQVQDILQSLFPAPMYGGALSSRQNNRNQYGAGSQLNSRATQLQNQGYNRGMNNSGFGGLGGGIGTGRTFGGQ